MRESTRLRVRYRYLNRFKLGGTLKECEDFVVREVIEPKFLRKFERKSGGVKNVEGRFLLVLVKKRGMTTPEVVNIIAKALGIDKNDIGYAGLKDKFSVSYHYMTIPAAEDEINSMAIKDIEISAVGRTTKKIFPGDLLANVFEITIHGCNAKALPKVAETLKKGVPNYFGYQRFGSRMDNHFIGRCLVKREFGNALKLINGSGFKYENIGSVPKKMLKFYVHAYQSWLFNETLFRRIGKNEKFSYITLFGCNSRLGKNDAILKEIIRKEKIDAEDFRFPELGISCPGGRRTSFIKIPDLEYKISGDCLKLKFTLPKGSYATNVLNMLGVRLKWTG